MRVWSFIQQKGGVGKTTLCLNLAVAAEARGEKVLVVDLDQQASAVFWSTTRGTNKPAVIDALPERIPDILKAAPELGATLCMIDAPSRLDPVALSGVRAADLIVCPTVPDLLNLAPLKETVTLIEAADKLRAAVCVLNNVEEAGAPKKKVLTTWQDNAALKQLKMLAVELEVSQQSLVAKGLNYVLNKYGRPSAAT